VGAAAAWTSGDVPDTLAHELHTDRREGWLDTTDSAVAAKDDGYRMRVGGCERDRRLEVRTVASQPKVGCDVDREGLTRRQRSRNDERA
jgi:hypothetical protein